MEKLNVLNLYVCTVTSGRDTKQIYVAADTFGRAASLCFRVILGWETHLSYEITNIELSYPVAVDSK